MSRRRSSPPPPPASTLRGSPAASASSLQTVPLGFLVFTILCTGSGIIMLELLGARIAGPIFGVSLYIWTALIAVTLASLSIGYWLGGALADRHPQPNMLYGIILIAGLWIAFLPLIDMQVLMASYDAFSGAWQIRLGVLLGAAILFAPPLTLLGMVSPYAIKLALTSLNRTGRTAGILYAISTVGSVAGTILAGYVLIPGIGITNTLLFIMAVVLTPAIAWFIIGRRWAAAGAAVAIGVLGSATAWSELDQPTLPYGIEILEKVDSQYGQLKVMDYTRTSRPVRWLLLEGTAQTGMYLDSFETDSYEVVSPYVQTMVNFLTVHPPRGGKALVVGLGGGAMIRPLRDLGFEVDIVEIDPKVAELSARYFGADPDLYTLITQDGRAYMRRTDKRYDVVLLDVFSGGGQPFHLFSLESFQDVRNVLAPGGYVGLNAIAFPGGGNAAMAQSLVQTASEVFDYRQIFAGTPGQPDDDIQNLLMFFSPQPFPEIDTAQRSEEEFSAYQYLYEQDAYGLKRPLELGADMAVVITDDLNPVDRWTAIINESWRHGLIQEDSDYRDVLMY